MEATAPGIGWPSRGRRSGSHQENGVTPSDFDDFETGTIRTSATRIFARWAGSGRPVLLLHGFPESHLMWRSVAPILAQHCFVVCADLRGYGASHCPVSNDRHEPYAKRAMAQDMVELMASLGHARFAVVGHDRVGASHIAWRWTIRKPALRSQYWMSCPPAKPGIAPTRALHWRTGPGHSLPRTNRCPNSCCSGLHRSSWMRRLADGARRRRCFLPPCAKPTSASCRIRRTHMRFAKSTARPHRATASTMHSTARQAAGWPVPSPCCGVLAARSASGTPTREDLWGYGANGQRRSSVAVSTRGTSFPRNARKKRHRN
ncbi:alpha/beta fold hydrolase [Variovorax beijingensis]|uniref:alpha/beta fold hydrolase n=1 Tax=Variovorax beijingensis TaxID=2496117 RepID=UPI0039655D80